MKAKIFYLHENQVKVFTDPARFVVLAAGRRFGKTVLALLWLLSHATKKCNGRSWYVAPTYRQAEMIAWKILCEILPPEQIVKKDSVNLEIVLVNGHEISLKGADNEDNLRGAGLNSVVLDEYAMMKQSIWNDIVRPMLTDSEGPALFIGTPKGKNHFYELYEQGKLGINEFSSHMYKTIDNPFISKSEIENARLSMDPKTFKREFESSFDDFEGKVFDQFDYNTNTIQDYIIPEHWKTGFVLDHGFTHPTAILWFARDSDGNVVVFDEHEESNKPVSYHAGIMKSKHKDLVGWCDPSIVAKTQSRGDKVYSIQDEYSDYGITLIPARRASEQYRINHVNEWFKKGKLKIFKSCVNTIREVQNWKWKTPTGKSLEVKEEPVDFQNDTCDCLTYLVEMLYEETVSKEIVVERYSPEWYVRQRQAQNAQQLFAPSEEDMINVINRNS